MANLREALGIGAIVVGSVVAVGQGVIPREESQDNVPSIHLEECQPILANINAAQRSGTNDCNEFSNDASKYLTGPEGVYIQAVDGMTHVEGIESVCTVDQLKSFDFAQLEGLDNPSAVIETLEGYCQGEDIEGPQFTSDR